MIPPWGERERDLVGLAERAAAPGPDSSHGPGHKNWGWSSTITAVLYRPGTAPTEAALPGSASAACSLGHLLGRLRTLLLQVLDHVPGLVDLRGKVLKVVRGDIKGFIAERRKILGRQDP